MIVLIDYKMGNLASIMNMLKKTGAEAMISSKSEDIQRADKLILPGVGAFDAGMTHINDLELFPILNEKALGEKIPILGICLGMQLMTRQSEEGSLSGLGWIAGETVRFHFDQEKSGLKIPHMGWNTVSPKQPNSLFKKMDQEAGYYFVHSYHVVCEQDSDVLGVSHYGYDFVSAFQKGCLYGTQFHPEKSHRYGMQVLRNFVAC
ncbi:MAG: imidazole glycerol phosphate synthase subunit HisH [Kiritimatiellae bacterium]|nr:imidazole glycerol phosphate synthase subunit HisH [Kiritimatiellia bacterium]